MNASRPGPWFRSLLRLYPRGFRERYGHELLESYERLLELGRAKGPLGVAQVHARVSFDLLAGAARERWRGGRAVRAQPHSGESGGRRALANWGRDVRFALRTFAKQPLFVLVAAGSLAVGIGAVTAVFSVANSLLIKPLPGIANYDRVVELGRSTQGRGFDTFAYPDFVDIREQVPALEAAAAYTIEVVSVSRDAEGVRAGGLHVTPGYFTLLGASLRLGRHFSEDEATGLGEHPVTVISHRFWSTWLGADPDVLESTLYLNRIPYRVIGVAAEEFRGHMIGFEPDIYMPMVQYPVMNEGRNDFDARNASWHNALGLLAEGSTLGELNAQLSTVGTRLAEAYPESNRRRSFRAMQLGPVPGSGRGGIRLFLGALLGMVFLILLVTCTNVAGMFLARALTREREVAIRLALGASRGRIIQQLTAESLIVFALGGVAGVAFAAWAVGWLRPELLPTPIPVRFDVSLDATVLLVALVTTLVTGVAFGLLPASRATRLDVSHAMKEEGRGGGRSSGRMRLIFAGTQVGLSLVLLTTAGLFVRSLYRAGTVQTGFDPTDSYVNSLDLSIEGYDDVEGPAFQTELLRSIRELPWVESASLSTDLPLDLSSSGTGVVPDGWEVADGAPMLSVDFNRVSDGYFETLRIPLRTGRTISESDRDGTPLVAVVSRTFVEEAWQGEEGIGRTFRFGSRSPDAPTYEIVGVVDDVKNQVLTESAKAFVYLPIAQTYAASIQVVVRSNVDRATTLTQFRSALAAADPNMSQGSIVSLGQFTSLGILPQRIAAGLTTGLGLLALLLSALGIYGVISYAVGRRRHEIGIRMALGADQRLVVRSFLRRGLILALPGIVIGGAVSVGVGRLLQTLLLGLSPYDPLTFVGVGTLLVAVVMFATWIPARRAAKVDPADSLRQE